MDEAFWSPSKYFTSTEPVTDDGVARVEKLLGYRLPRAYVELLRTQNGGQPARGAFPTTGATSWADDHVAIDGIAGIGGKWGLDADPLGSRFMISEWGYPEIGIVFGQCPSAGHDAIMLDYRACGPEGEPAVVHVDVESRGGPKITPLAPSFGAFLEGLVDAATFNGDEEAREQAIVTVERGTFSPVLRDLVDHASAPPPFEGGALEAALRALAKAVVDDKGFFALHADPRSVLFYDLQFWLWSERHDVNGEAEYLRAYPSILVHGPGFSTGGYAPGFIKDWLAERVASGAIERQHGLLKLSPAATKAMFEAMATYTRS